MKKATLDAVEFFTVLRDTAIWTGSSAIEAYARARLYELEQYDSVFDDMMERLFT